MNPTLDRMVLGMFMRLFIVFLVCVPTLFVVLDLSEQQDRFIDRGLEFAQIALGYLYSYPYYMQQAFPVAAQVAAVFSVHSMTAHREIMAAKAGGISFYRLVAPLWPAGAALTVAAFLLGAALPTTNRRAAEVWGEREIRQDWRQTFVHQTEENKTLSARHLSVSRGSMGKILVERVDDDGVLHHMYADEAVFTDSLGWTLRNGRRRRIGPDGTETSWTFDRYRDPELTVRPEELLDGPARVEEMSYEELGERAASVRRSGGDPRELLVERETKLAIPAATFVIVVFGASLGTTSRKRGASFGVGVSLASTLLYILLLNLFAAIGSAGGIPPLMAAWSPNALFLVVGAVLLARVRT